MADPGGARDPPAQVAVLATLHQLHATTPAYSYEALGQVIERLQPDVLCVELQPDDLQRRPVEATKQEYPRVVYPLIDRHHYRAYAMEPAEPAYSDILTPYIRAGQDFSVREPEQAEAFSRYSDGAYIGLQTYWTSPAWVAAGADDETGAAQRVSRPADDAMAMTVENPPRYRAPYDFHLDGKPGAQSSGAVIISWSTG